MILAGDIGGTKTNLALYRGYGGRPRPESSRRYKTSAFENPADMIDAFLTESRATVDYACLAVAGPVMDGRSRLTNLSWTLSDVQLARRFGWRRCLLLNDVEATAHALPLLEASELNPIRTAAAHPGGNLGILAPGTGLGVALAIQRGGAIIPIASEAGHADFAPIDDESLDLWRFIAGRHDHVSQESIISGQRLRRIYQWRRHLGDEHPDPSTGRSIDGSEDPSAAITKLALEDEDPVCIKTLDCFTRYLGAAAGNLALTATTLGGIYLAGGIPPKILPALQSGVFEEAFLAKGRFRSMLETIAVRVVMLEAAPVLGAAKAALDAAGA